MALQWGEKQDGLPPGFPSLVLSADRGSAGRADGIPHHLPDGAYSSAAGALRNKASRNRGGGNGDRCCQHSRNDAHHCFIAYRSGHTNGYRRATSNSRNTHVNAHAASPPADTNANRSSFSG
jgi:hypothetical protein